MTDELQKVGNYWSSNEPIANSGSFILSPITRPYIIEKAFGKEFVAEYKDNRFYAIDIFITKYLKNRKIKSILSLCCGFGYVERRFVSKIADIKQCLGLDVAEGAIESARKSAIEEGIFNISYEVADLNNYKWEKEKYDLVIANGALHHINNLESVLEGIRDTLKPGGILYGCEYVGPSYQDHAARQFQLINAVAFLVPPELRARKGLYFYKFKRLFRLISKIHSVSARDIRPEWASWKKNISKIVKFVTNQNRNDFNFGVVHISRKDDYLRKDPSECVRSAEILPLMKNYFPNMEVKEIGGGILEFALDENFYERFDANNYVHVKTLDMLCMLERHYMETGEIDNEFAFIIANK